MKIKVLFLLFTSSFLLCSDPAEAGDRELNQEEISKALELWRQHCLDGDENGGSRNSNEIGGYGGSGGYGNGGGDGGGGDKRQIYCKFGKDYDEPKEPVVIRPTFETPKEPVKQIIFITPPAYNYKHEITLQQAPAPPRKTTVYVFPARNTHQFNIQDNRDKSTKTLKPMVYFLKNNILVPKEGGYASGYASGNGYNIAPSSIPLAQIQRDPSPPPTQITFPTSSSAPSGYDTPQQPQHEKSLETVNSQQINQRELISEVQSSLPDSSYSSRQPLYETMPILTSPYYGAPRSVNVILQQPQLSKQNQQSFINEPIQLSSSSGSHGFEIIPATFKGYYYTGPNDINKSTLM